MKKIIISALVLSVVAMGSAFAAPAHHENSGHSQTMGSTMAGSAMMGTALTEEQSNKLSSMLEEQRKAVAPLHAKLTEKKAELHLAKVSVKKDPQKIITLSKELGELMGQLEVSKIAFNDKLEKEGLAEFYHHGGMGGMMHGGMRGMGGMQMKCMEGGMGKMGNMGNMGNMSGQGGMMHGGPANMETMGNMGGMMKNNMQNTTMPMNMGKTQDTE